MRILGEKIRLLREAKGWSQDDFAQKTGITKNTISEIELGKKEDSKLSTAAKLAKHLGVKPYEILDDGPEPITFKEALEVIRDRYEEYIATPPLTETETKLIDHFRSLGKLMQIWVMWFVSGDEKFRREFDEYYRSSTKVEKTEVERQLSRKTAKD